MKSPFGIRWRGDRAGDNEPGFVTGCYRPGRPDDLNTARMGRDMGGETFGSLSLGTPAREFRPDSAEPRLFPGDGSASADPPAVASEGAGSAAWEEAPVPETWPATPALGRRLAAAAAELPAGTWLYLILIGLVATMTIAAFFGIGFLLLAAPANQTIAVSERNAARPSAPISLEAGMPPSAAPAAIPGPSLAPHPAVDPIADEAPPLPQSTTGQALLPASPVGKPPAQAASAPNSPPDPASRPDLADHRPGPASAAPISPAARTDTAARPPSFPEEAALQGATSPPTRYASTDRARPASRHWHHRSARNGRSPAARRPRFAQALTPPQAGAMSPMDQLLTQLTEQPKSARQSMTPPPADPSGPGVSHR